jgi:membrane protease YdiL (CAAX protease family)
MTTQDTLCRLLAPSDLYWIALCAKQGTVAKFAIMYIKGTVNPMDPHINPLLGPKQRTRLAIPVQTPSKGSLIFHGPNGLRAGWRVLIFVLLVVALRFALNAGAHLATEKLGLSPPSSAPITVLQPGAVAGRDALLFAIILIASAIMGRIEHRRLSHYGLPWEKPFPKNFWVGLLWGFLAMSGVLFVVFLLRGCRITGVDTHGAALGLAFLEWAGAFLLVGFFEEFTFRGYMQFTLTTGIGFWTAAILLSILFLLAHVGNSGESVFGVVQVAAFGIFLCIVLRRTGNLWWAIGFHAAWDWAETFFYGVPDSGVNASHNFLHSEFHGPNWLTGGSTGPEGSVLTLIALVILSLLVIRRYPQTRYPAPDALGLRKAPGL